MASGLYSHPGVPLEDHSNRVLALARRLLDESAHPWWNEPPRRDLLETAITLHDFGKATNFFQAVLRGERRKDRLSRHAHLSALFFLHRSEAWLGPEGVRERWKTLLFAYVAIHRHHTDLRSVWQDLSSPDEDGLEVLQEQVEHIPLEKANAFLQALDVPAGPKTVLVFDPDAFLAWIRDESPRLFSAWRRIWRQEKKGLQDSEAFFAFLSGFSALLDADKLDAGAEGYLPARVALPANAVERYKRHAFGPPPTRGLDALREQAYHEVLDQLMSPDKHLYTLTLPTGMGKTLTGMAAALKLREMVTKATGRTPHIIYALPFLSVIDQNARTLDEVFSTAMGQVDSRVLIKHHHLADLQYRERDRKNESLREWDYAASRLLTGGWHSEVVVTTFIQLFDTLLAWRNGTARRANRLSGAILLLDEVQALPSVYWPLTRHLLHEAAHQLDAYIILMTATQPYLLEDAGELVPAPDRYFRALDRLDASVDLSQTSLEEFVERFHPSQGKSYLFMANTIASAQQLHHLLKETLGEDVAFLSTGVTPKERLERIEALRAGSFRFAVSTQLIEAGVDVDFDVIYRDLAPLDSLIQAAGRCNRNLTPGKRGAFHIVHWVDEQKRSFSRWIYDPVLLERTEKRLQGRTHMREPDFIALLADYFRDVWDTGIPDKVATELWDAVRTLRFDGERDTPCVRRSSEAAGAYISQFCLIEQQPYKRDVFIQVDEDAVAVGQKAKSILNELRRTDDLWAAREQFAKLKPRFAQYVVSVALKPETAPQWDDDLHIYVVPKEALEYFYDLEIGFKRQRGEDASIW